MRPTERADLPGSPLFVSSDRRTFRTDGRNSRGRGPESPAKGLT